MPQILKTDETLIIETPERVSLEFTLASVGNRFLAVVIDHMIQLLSGIIVFWMVRVTDILSGVSFSSSSDENYKWIMVILIVSIFLIFTGYFIFFEWFWNGQTPGKKLMKLRVIREDGRPITLWESMARNLLRIFDAIPGMFYSVGLIAIFASTKDQRVGDMFAGTVVVRERADEVTTFSTTFFDTSNDDAFRRVQKRVDFKANADPITESEMEVVEMFLRRRWILGQKQRIWLAWRIALPIMYKLRPKYDSEGFSYEGFLEELLHRFHRS